MWSLWHHSDQDNFRLMSQQKSHTGTINITSDSEKAWQMSKNNPHSYKSHQGDHMPAINKKTPMLSQQCQACPTTFVHPLVLPNKHTPLCSEPIKSLRKCPYKNNNPSSPSQLRPWELKKHLLQKQDQATCFPLLGWVSSMSCLSAIPFVFLCFTLIINSPFTGH